MGYTLAEKLIMANTGQTDIAVGDLVTVSVDQVMVHDLFAPFVAEKFREMGFKKVWDPDKIVFIYDHLVPTSFIEDTRMHRLADEFALEQGIEKVHRTDGVCHQLMVEQKYATPGKMVFGTDSHTTTYGAVCAFATGIGYTEMASIFGTGKLWLKVPPTIRFIVEGELPFGVFAKDIILKIIGDIGVEGATYQAMEFGGSTIEGLSISSRMTLANMAVEAGAKVGLIAPDQKTFDYCGVDRNDLSYLQSDHDATFAKVYEYKAEEFEPVVACPSSVDKVKSVREVLDTPIDQAFLGSCTNGRLEDLAIAARIIKGKKVAPYIKFIVTPASRDIYAQALKEGYIGTLLEAGAVLNPPACGLCCGRSGGIIGDGERVIATNNRNFIGRMGAANSEIYLASPATVTASVIEGKITDPRGYLDGN